MTTFRIDYLAQLIDQTSYKRLFDIYDAYTALGAVQHFMRDIPAYAIVKDVTVTPYDDSLDVIKCNLDDYVNGI